MTNRLKGKVAIVTGSASGIGRACAIALAAEGAKVFHTDIDETGGKETEAAIISAGGEACFALQEVADETRWNEIFAETKSRFGTPNILVNNAGIGIGGPIVDYSFEDWRKLMTVNVDSVFLGTRAAMRAMSDGGSIINMSSIMGLRGAANNGAYSATKGAVKLFTKSAALEGAKMSPQIRVNSVHPGFIETPIYQKSERHVKRRKQLLAHYGLDPDSNLGLAQLLAKATTPFGRAGEAMEIAQTVVFLASDESSYTTGAELVVDGGWNA